MSARPAPLPASRDPLVWCWAIAAGFLLLTLHRLTIPSKPFFDEIHYLPAARALLTLDKPVNREHPLVAKELMAGFIALFGDRPFGWRIGSALAGAAALMAAMRGLW
jgi:dolichyl-phosphate-mannose--protein O-mannosyl transferase